MTPPKKYAQPQHNRRNAQQYKTLHQRRSWLEDELHRQLHLARRHGVHDLAEAGAAADVSVDRGGAEELRMVEDVEGFHAELQRFAFRE